MFKKIKENMQKSKERNNNVIDESIELGEKFNSTQSNDYLEIDETHQLWKLKSNPFHTYRDEYITDYELIRDDEQVTSGGLGVGRAIVGGALFGGTGAILGGLTKSKTTKKKVSDLYIRVNFELFGESETKDITFIKKKTKMKSGKYKRAIQEGEKTIQMLDDLTHEDEVDEPVSAAGELMKYKELLDIDAITQEEFDEVKKKLLS